MQTKTRFARRFGWVLPGVAALAGCVDMEPPPPTDTTTSAVSSTVWECTVTCSCRYSFGVIMKKEAFYSTTSTVSASRSQSECESDCYELDSLDYRSALAGPTTCTAWETGGGSGSGSGSEALQ